MNYYDNLPLELKIIINDFRRKEFNKIIIDSENIIKKVFNNRRCKICIENLCMFNKSSVSYNSCHHECCKTCDFIADSESQSDLDNMYYCQNYCKNNVLCVNCIGNNSILENDEFGSIICYNCVKLGII